MTQSRTTDMATAPTSRRFRRRWAAGAGKRILSLERVGEPGARGSPRGRQAQQQSAEQLKTKVKSSTRQSTPTLRSSGTGAGRWERGEARVAHKDRAHPATSANSEQDALDQHLSLQPSARGSQRKTYRHLALAARRAQKQVGHIGARNEKHQQRHQRERGKKDQHRAAFPGGQRTCLLEDKALPLSVSG